MDIATLIGKGIRRLKRDAERMRIAKRFLRGKGLEVGALHAPLRVPFGVNVRYVDRMTTPELRAHYTELRFRRFVFVSIVDNGETLSRVPDEAYDFIIANHVFEHYENPLRALSSMLRVVKEGGVVYLSVPDMRSTFDKHRTETSFEHVLRDYRKGADVSRRSHLDEWARFVDGVEDETARARRVEELIAHEYSIHYHAWTPTGLARLLLSAGSVIDISYELECFERNGEEVIAVIRKHARISS